MLTSDIDRLGHFKIPMLNGDFICFLILQTPMLTSDIDHLLHFQIPMLTSGFIFF